MGDAVRPVDQKNSVRRCHERRGKPRITCEFPAIVRGGDGEGPRFQTTGTVENLSASGMFLRVERTVERGARLFIVFRISPGAPDAGAGPIIAVHGRALHSELTEDRQCRVVVRLQHYRFL